MNGEFRDGREESFASSSRTLRIVGRLLGVGVVVAPALQALWFVRRYGMNLPHADEWRYLSFSWKMPSLGFLWAQHNEHRVPVGKLLVAAVERFSGCDVRAGMYVSWAFLVAISAILWLRRRGSLLAFAPVVWIVFTLRQSENLLWGMQCEMVLSVLLSVATFFLLDGARPRLMGAIACAAGASLSFGNGLLVWPVGLLQLLAARRSRLTIAGWTGTGTLVTAAYLWDWVRPPYHPVPFANPFQTLDYFLVCLGSPFSGEIGTARLVGIGVLCALALTFAWAARSRRLEGRTLMPAALVALAVAGAALLAIGRGGFGTGQALQSRYVSFSLLAFAGGWMVATDAALAMPVRGLAAVLIVAGSLWARMEVVRDCRHDEMRLVRAAQALLSYRLQPDDALTTLYPDATVVRAIAPELEKRRLSLFRDAADLPSGSAARPGSAEVHLDPVPAAIPLDGYLEISGTARIGDERADGVLLRMDSRLDVRCFYGVMRRGIRDGFFAAVPAKVLGPGRHEIQLLPVSDGSRAFAVAGPSLEVIIR